MLRHCFIRSLAVASRHQLPSQANEGVGRGSGELPLGSRDLMSVDAAEATEELVLRTLVRVSAQPYGVHAMLAPAGGTAALSRHLGLLLSALARPVPCVCSPSGCVECACGRAAADDSLT